MEQPRMEEQPWWLQPGTELCLFCGGYYQAEVFVYCVGCDQLVCQSCYVKQQGRLEIHCPDCCPTAEQ